MIEKLTDAYVLSGVLSPLLPLLYADYRYSTSDIDGVYVQRENDVIQSFISVKNGCATVCVEEDDFSREEMESFLSFLHIGQVLSDVSLGDGYRSIPFLGISPKPCDIGDLPATSPVWKMSQYKSLYRLLADENDSFDSWFADFSRRVNDGFACGVATTDYCSCAVAPCIYGDSGIIAGVYTEPQYRGQGLAQKCIKGLLGTLNAKGIKNIYLWCNEDKVRFYEKSGFRVIGSLYIREEM